MVSQINRLNIGSRLVLCFAVIVLLMFLGNILLIWQFFLVSQQSARVTALATELTAVSGFQNDILSMDARLDVLAKAADLDALRREAEHLRLLLSVDSESVRDSLSHLPSDVPPDLGILSTVEAVKTTLPPQLDAVIALGAASDWDAVRLRLANEKAPLESSTSDLVRNVQWQVNDELAKSVAQAERLKRRVLLIVPSTTLLSLLASTLLGLVVTRSICDPLRELMRGSTALARADFDHQVPLTGSDELAHLGAVFNETTTKLRELYKQIQSSEVHLAEAQQLAHMGSFAIDGTTRETVHWSEEMFRLFSCDPHRGVPTWDQWLQWVHPEDRELVAQTTRNMLDSNKAFDFRFRIVWPNGNVRHVRYVGTQREVSQGFVGTAIDVTEQEQLEQERERLRQLQADLAHTNRVSMLGELAVSLAHEIKQPIAAAITSAHSCIEWLAHEPPNLDRARAAADRVDKYGTRAAEIIDRIRSFYRKSPPQRELVDVNGIIQEMLTLLESEAKRYSVAVRTNLTEGLPKIMADRVQLQQVCMNLMLNSIEAMRDSGGELTVTSQLQNRQLQFSVSDTGVGLPTEDMGRIFSAFFTTKPQGSGMGLAISRSIVESHGGHLWATANGAQGAVFHFTLPDQAAETSPSVS